MTRRSAFSLVEILVTLSIGSTVLAIAIGTVHRSMQVCDTAQSTSHQSLHLNRFLAQFRNDVHLGIAIESLSKQSVSIELADNSKIVYSVEGNTVTRSQKSFDDAPVRESAHLAENTDVSFEFEERSRAVTFRIFKNLDLYQAPPRLERFVKAILGRTATSYLADEVKP